MADFLSQGIAEAGNNLMYLQYFIGMWENARDLERVIRICPNLISFLLRELCLSFIQGILGPRSKLRKKDAATGNGRQSRSQKTLQMLDILYLINTFVSNNY